MSEEKYGHYYKDVSKIHSIDVYMVCELFNIEDHSGSTQHAIKKLLCSGQRGVKGELKDLQEAVDTLNRRIAMLKGVGRESNEGHAFRFEPVWANTPHTRTSPLKKTLEDAYDEPDNDFDIRDAIKGQEQHLNLQNNDDDYWE